jgi:hypothetical protein
VGGLVGTVGGKLLGGVSGIALSKILEVYDKIKASKIKKMATLPQLMANISPESQIMRGLMALTLEREEEEQIATIVENAIKSQSLYPSLAEFQDDNCNITQENCEKAKELTNELFTDENLVEYFILTPIRDDNAPEEFASSTDLLVLRWPIEVIKPWESEGEKVLDINDLNVKN